MKDRQRPAERLGVGGDLEGAPRVAGGHRLGARVEQVPGFAPTELFGGTINEVARDSKRERRTKAPLLPSVQSIKFLANPCV